MNVLKIALGVSAMGFALGCSSTGSSSGNDLRHSIPLDASCQVIFTSSAPRTDGDSLFLKRVRCELTDEEAGITEVQLILFDDLNEDGLLQVEEERGEVSGTLGTPSSFVEWSGLRGPGPMEHPSLWTRLVTDRGEVIDCWPVGS